MKRYLLLTLASRTPARAARDRTTRALTAMLGHLAVPVATGANRQSLTLSLSALALASLAYCLAPRLGLALPSASDTIAINAIQDLAGDHAPALDTYRDALQRLSAGDEATARRL